MYLIWCIILFCCCCCCRAMKQCCSNRCIFWGWSNDIVIKRIPLNVRDGTTVSTDSRCVHVSSPHLHSHSQKHFRYQPLSPSLSVHVMSACNNCSHKQCDLTRGQWHSLSSVQNSNWTLMLYNLQHANHPPNHCQFTLLPEICSLSAASLSVFWTPNQYNCA